MDLHFSINSFVHTRICTAPLLSPAEGKAVLSQAFCCVICGPTILWLENHTDDMPKDQIAQKLCHKHPFYTQN